jgi:hypothetical protein
MSLATLWSSESSYHFLEPLALAWENLKGQFGRNKLRCGQIHGLGLQLLSVGSCLKQPLRK